MNNTKWLGLVFIAFIAGFMTNNVYRSSTDSQQASQQTAQNELQPQVIHQEKLNTANINEAAIAAKKMFSEKKSPAAQQSSNQNQAAANPQAMPSDINPTTSIVEVEPQAEKYPNEVSDTEIDTAIPAPFNEALKNTHGGMREKYKGFLATNQTTDWEITMQNKLSDFILSNPYAKFIAIESLKCKVNLCEIMLFESKKGAWPSILSELAMQDWWDIGGVSSSGNLPRQNTKETGTYYVLLSRK